MISESKFTNVVVLMCTTLSIVGWLVKDQCLILRIAFSLALYSPPCQTTAKARYTGVAILDHPQFVTMSKGTTIENYKSNQIKTQLHAP